MEQSYNLLSEIMSDPDQRFRVDEAYKARADVKTLKGSIAEATRLAEEQGALAITDMMIVDAHVQLKDQSAKTCKIARRAYWHARTAFRGWRALRSIG